MVSLSECVARVCLDNKAFPQEPAGLLIPSQGLINPSAPLPWGPSCNT